MCKPSSEENLFASANNHGNKITAIVDRDNILSVQFQPERSKPVGLNFFKLFIETNQIFYLI